MLRILGLTLFIAVLYILFSVIKTYDSVMHIEIASYAIDVNSFFLAAVMVIFGIIVFTISRLLSVLLSCPRLISSCIAARRKRSDISSVLDAYAALVLSDSSMVEQSINNARNDLSKDLELHKHIILSQLNEDSKEMRIFHLRYLLDNTQYAEFALRKLIICSSERESYKQVIEYAIKYFDTIEMPNDFCDIEVLVSVAVAYFNLGAYDKFDFYASMLRLPMTQNIDMRSVEHVAECYLKVARSFIDQRDDEKAIEFVEKALALLPCYLDAISVLCELNINFGRSSQNRHILTSAFSLSPSFEIFEIFAELSSLSPEDIYEELSSVVNVENYRCLFIAISACLGLDRHQNNIITRIEE